MKKVMIIGLYTVFVCASDYNDIAKEIERLKKKAYIAGQNGLVTVAESYLKSVEKLQEQANKSNANTQPAHSNK